MFRVSPLTAFTRRNFLARASVWIALVIPGRVLFLFSQSAASNATRRRRERLGIRFPVFWPLPRAVQYPDPATARVRTSVLREALSQRCRCQVGSPAIRRQRAPQRLYVQYLD